MRCVILALCVTTFVLVLKFSASTGLTVVAVVSLVGTWFIGIEGGLIPYFIERALTKRASSSGEPLNSIWFVDLEQQRESNRHGFVEDTKDNPTIR